MSNNNFSGRWTKRLIRLIIVYFKLVCVTFGIILGISLGFVFVSFRQFHDSKFENEQNEHMDTGRTNLFSLGANQNETYISYSKIDNYSIFGYPFTSDDSSVADNLTSNIRILCWVWCTGRDLYNQTLAIRKTWGRKCQKLLIFTDTKVSGIDSIDFSSADVTYSWSRYILAYRYAYKHYKDVADWFFGTFDETYVCMENLRFFLSDKDSSEPNYYGHKLILEDLDLEFVDARVGCILSKEALNRLGTSGKTLKECNEMEPAGEKQLGACLNNLGIKIGQSTDSYGRTLFLSFPPALQIGGLQSSWFMQQDMEGRHKGVESISRYAITFSGMTAFFMYGIECYLYHMRPFGIFHVDPEPDQISFKQEE